MTKKAPTLKDVAMHAGVSLMAASAVLNRGKSTSRVSEVTRQRILAASEEIGYQADAVAKALRGDRVGAIGFYNGLGFIDPADEIISDVFHGLHLECTNRDVDLLLYNGLHLMSHDDALSKLTENKVDGVVVLPRPEDFVLVETLMSSQQTVVSLREPVENGINVVADDESASAKLAGYLADLGHMTVMYRRSRELYPSRMLRCIGFHAAAVRRGVILIESTAEVNGKLSDVEKEMLVSHRDRHISAVACSNDLAAYETIMFCLEEGIRVPEDLSIVGFDGLAVPGALAGFELTTMKVDWLKMARIAVDRVLNERGGGDLVSRNTLHPTMFIPGNTTTRAPLD